MTPGAPIRPLNGQKTCPEKVRKKEIEKKNREKERQKEKETKIDGKKGRQK